MLHEKYNCCLNCKVSFDTSTVHSDAGACTRCSAPVVWYYDAGVGGGWCDCWSWKSGPFVDVEEFLIFGEMRCPNCRAALSDQLSVSPEGFRISQTPNFFERPTFLQSLMRFFGFAR